MAEFFVQDTSATPVQRPTAKTVSRVVEEPEPEEDSPEVRSLKELVLKNPWSYMLANAIADGNPPEVLRALHYYKNSDKAKEMLGRFLAGLPDGLEFDYNAERVDQFLDMEPSLRAQGLGLVSRKSVRVNKYNAASVLAQFVAWVPIKPSFEDLANEKIRVRTSSGEDFIDYSSVTALTVCVGRILKEKDAGKSGYQYSVDVEDPMVHNLVYFLMSVYHIAIEEGKYATNKNYYGDTKVPESWRKLAYAVAKHLEGKTPSCYLSMDQDLRAYLYSDVCDALTENPEFREIRKKASVHNEFIKKAQDAVAKAGFTKEGIKEQYQKYAQQNWPANMFTNKTRADLALSMRRQNNEANYDELFGEKQIGFEYSDLSSAGFSSFTTLYMAICAVCLKMNLNPVTQWEGAVKSTVNLILCGQDVANRATILEDICQVIGWNIIVSAQHKVKTGSYATRMKDDADWNSIETAKGALTVVAWLGLKGVEISDPVPIPTEGTPDDRAVLQLVTTFDKIPNNERIVLIVHHDVTKPGKFAEELDYLDSLPKTSVALIAHPAVDSSGMSWVAMKKEDRLNNLAFRVWGTKLIECTAAKEAMAVSVAWGYIRNVPSCLLLEKIAKYALCAVQWQRISTRQAGKKVHDDKTEKILKKFSTRDKNRDWDVEGMVTEDSGIKKRSREEDTEHARMDLVTVLAQSAEGWLLELFRLKSPEEFYSYLSVASMKSLQELHSCISNNKTRQEFEEAALAVASSRTGKR